MIKSLYLLIFSSAVAFSVEAPTQLTPYKNGLLYVKGADLFYLDNRTFKSSMIASGHYPEGLAATSSLGYFYSSQVANAGRIWTTNGTSAGTRLVKEVALSGTGSSYYENPITPMGKKVFFRGITSEHGAEPWYSDGTFAGTNLLKDIYWGYSSSRPEDFTAAGRYVYFNANDGTHGNGLWRTDGTPSGTKMLLYGAKFINMTAVGSNLYFCHENGFANLNGGSLQVADGNSTREIMQFKQFAMPSNLTQVGNQLFFTVDSDYYGIELWKSNGTVSGTTIVKDIYPYNGSIYGYSSRPTNLAAAGNILYFAADDGVHGVELWRSDGTQGGTYLVKNINEYGDSTPDEFTMVGGKVYFTAYTPDKGRELWVTDGTEAGTKLYQDIYTGSPTSGISDLTHVNGSLFFVADSGSSGRVLWGLKIAPQPEPNIVVSSGSNGKKLKNGKALISFGLVKLGKKSITRNIVVKNTGKVKLNGIKVTLEGRHKNHYRVAKLRKNSLDTGDSLTIKVYFRPKSHGLRKALLYIASNDPDDNPFKLKISGSGMK